MLVDFFFIDSCVYIFLMTIWKATLFFESLT